MLLNLVKRKKKKQKTKEVLLSQIYCNYFNFYKQNNLIEVKDKLELFCHDNTEIKANNEEQIKDSKKEKLYFLKLFNYVISY